MPYETSDEPEELPGSVFARLRRGGAFRFGKDRGILAEPIGDRLFFAGEATSREYPATAHGAYFSGGREGRRISSSQ
jgi:hypothetical protein